MTFESQTELKFNTGLVKREGGTKCPKTDSPGNWVVSQWHEAQWVLFTHAKTHLQTVTTSSTSTSTSSILEEAPPAAAAAKAEAVIEIRQKQALSLSLSLSLALSLFYTQDTLSSCISFSLYLCHRHLPSIVLCLSRHTNYRAASITIKCGQASASFFPANWAFHFYNSKTARLIQLHTHTHTHTHTLFNGHLVSLVFFLSQKMPHAAIEFVFGGSGKSNCTQTRNHVIILTVFLFFTSFRHLLNLQLN